MSKSSERGAKSVGEQKVCVVEKGGVVTITLGRAEERTVILDESRMTELRTVVDGLSKRRDLLGVVFRGSRSGMFCAGADVRIIQQVTSEARGEELARLGQELFQAIEDLPCPTVAAIAGPCVGGGCELVLACRYRVALNTPQTKIGLPEIKLGILPGFGGTQRLPRLIGLPGALDIILSGKVLPAKRAAKVGLVDEVLSPEEGESEESAFQRLLSRAMGKIQNPPRRHSMGLKEWVFTRTGLGRKVVKTQALRSVMKETKGHYPAPLRALEVTVFGLERGGEQGFVAERRELGRLIVSPESKALTHLYFISEDAQKLGRNAKEEVAGAKICVVGGGTMGSGIAASAILSGFETVVVEPYAPVRERVVPFVKGVISKRRSLSEGEMLSRLTVVESVAGAQGADIVIEAIVEDREKKRALYQELLPLISERGVIASNTSSIPIAELSAGGTYGERLVGMHFFNPAEKMPLVEIIRSRFTAERTTVYVAALTAALGKYPVVVDDVPGFLVNKILTPYLAEASSLLRDGASIQAIDDAAVQFGFPMGPFRLLDEIGLDVAAKVSAIMEQSYGAGMKGEGYIDELVTQGRLGKKSNSGFYLHTEEGGTPNFNPPTSARVPSGGEITERLTMAMMNEALRSLHDGVAGVPGPEAEAQIDLASVMGFGFPPFRGGLLHYCKGVGIASIRERLTALCREHGERFRPWDDGGEHSRGVQGECEGERGMVSP